MSCPSSGGPTEPEEDLEISGLEIVATHATWVDIRFCTKEEAHNLSTYEYKLYKGNSEEVIDTCCIAWANTVYIYENYEKKTPLTPDTKYKLDILYTGKDQKTTLTKQLDFTTSKYDFSDFTLSYSNSEKKVWIKSSELANFNNLTAYRSESENGEFNQIEIKPQNESITFISYYDADSENLAPGKTYYYKFAIKNSEGSVLYQTATPKSIKTSSVPPEKVNSDSVKTIYGIKSFKVTWDSVENAEAYDILVQDYNTNKDILKTSVTEPEFIFDFVQNIKDWNPESITPSFSIYITAKNDGGSADRTLSFYSNVRLNSKLTVSDINVVPGQKEAVYSFTPDFYVEDDCSVQYILAASYSEVETNPMASSTESVITRKNLKIQTDYKSYNDTKPGNIYIKAEYKDKSGNTKSYVTTGIIVPGFTTAEFDPVSGLEFMEAQSKSIKYKFTPLTQEQSNNQNINYYEVFNDGSRNTINRIENPSAASQTRNNLKEGTVYTLTIIPSNTTVIESNLKEFKNCSPIEVITNSALSKPTNVTLSQEAGALDTQPLLKVTWDKIAEDTSAGSVIYEVEYKIFKWSKYSNFINEQTSKKQFTSTGADTVTASMPVNAGNRYMVRVLAYKADDVNCKAYSEVKTIQLTKYDDRALVTALTYPQNMGNKAEGDVIDFSDPNVWTDSKAPKTGATGGFNFGITQFMGEAVPEYYHFPVGNPAFVSFKFSLDSDPDKPGIDASYIPRIIFLDYEGFHYSLRSVRDDFGKFDKVYILMPDRDGLILETLEPEDLNMPLFTPDSDGTPYSVISPASSGIQVNESWVYNNSIYLGVLQRVAGNLGFSYFY